MGPSAAHNSEIIKIPLLLNLIPMEIVVTQRIEVSHAKHEHYEIEECPQKEPAKESEGVQDPKFFPHTIVDFVDVPYSDVGRKKMNCSTYQSR